MVNMQQNPSFSDEKVYRATYRAKEAFIESCSALYNDIFDIKNFQQDSSIAKEIVKRRMELESQGAELSEVVPHLSNMVTYKLRTIDLALETASSNDRYSGSGVSKKGDISVAIAQLRKWILTTNEKLSNIEAEVAQPSISFGDLKTLRRDQQVFQKRIENEGRVLTDNVNKCIKRLTEGATEEPQSNVSTSRHQRRLKALTQRWHDIWLRSLAVICRADTVLGHQQEVEDCEVSDDLREPPSKKRRTLESCTSKSYSSALLESEEDTIPFTEDEYERIYEKSIMSQTSSNINKSTLTVEDTEHQPDIGYSSGENSVSDLINDINHKSTAVNVSDSERRMRIDTSPVKSFYKTVPLDDAGVTDTEIPRFSSTPLVRNSKNDFLTDSMVVNVEENFDSHLERNMEDILALLNEDFGVDGGKKYFREQLECVKQGTRWRQISSAQRGKRSSQRSLPVYKQHSCDASSEESEEELFAASASSAVKNDCNSMNSLKRRYKTFNSSSCLCTKEDLQSEPSTSNGVTDPSHRSFSPQIYFTDWSITTPYRKRKLRVRRLPRSVSNIESFNNLMSVSTHSAPGATNFFHNSCADSDETAPEQSDAPPYEWDDYNPPAKVEDDDGLEQKEDSTALTFDDDYQMHFGDDLKCYIIESQASLRSANALLNRHPTRQSLEDLRTMANAHAERLSALATANPLMPTEHLSCLDEVNKGWKKVLTTIDSLTLTTSIGFDLSSQNGFLPAILSKVEKFASSLRCLQESDEGCKSSMRSVSSIKSLDDVINTLKVFGEIHDRLVAEREELQSLLHSDTFPNELIELMAEFEPLSTQYEEAIEKVEQLIQQVEKVKQNWSDWAETQSNLQYIISGIEEELSAMRKGNGDCSQIASELEICQERMNRLETVCNYLTASLSELPDNSSASKAMDFAAQLTNYSTAVMQLKRKFELLKDPVVATIDKATSTIVEKNLKSKLWKKFSYHFPSEQSGFSYHISWQTILLLCSAAIAFFAWFASSKTSSVNNNWKNAPGLHLEYVNGPPPM